MYIKLNWQSTSLFKGITLTQTAVKGNAQIGALLRWGKVSSGGGFRHGLTRTPASAPICVQASRLLRVRSFELKDHLGNVRVIVSDQKDANAAAQVQSYYNYYAFGMEMPNRTYDADKAYRYGFNGKENDKDFGTAGLTQDYGFRLYNPAIAKFLSVDPLSNTYSSWTPYAFAMNRAIDGVDIDGLEYMSHIMFNSLSEPVQKAIHSSGVIKGTISYKGVSYYKLSKHVDIVKQYKSGTYTRRISKWVYEFVDNPTSYVPYSGDCKASCNQAIEVAGFKIGYTGYGSSDMIQMINTPGGKNGVGSTPTKSNRLAAIELLNQNIQEGKPTIAGVNTFVNGVEDKDDNNKKIDNVTDHYIIIVGKGEDKIGKYFIYHENAVSDNVSGTNSNFNRLYIQDDLTLKGKTPWDGNLTGTEGQRSTKITYEVTNVTKTYPKD